LSQLSIVFTITDLGISLAMPTKTKNFIVYHVRMLIIYIFLVFLSFKGREKKDELDLFLKPLFLIKWEKRCLFPAVTLSDDSVSLVIGKH
jgi:hypothetical protein